MTAVSDVAQALRAISVDGLFGHRNVTIHLDPEQPTILTGLNGTGKSTILRLVNAVSLGDLETLTSAPMTGMRLEFRELPRFEIKQLGEKQWELAWGPYRDEITNVRANLDLPTWAMDALREHNFDPKLTTDNLIETVSRLGVRPDEYRTVREQLQSFTAEDLQITGPDWLQELQTAFNVIFVTDQRLVVEQGRRRLVTGRTTRHYSPARRPSSRAVEAASNDIANQIAFADSDYARRSQAIDKRFPAEVISAMQSKTRATKQRVIKLQEEVESRREELRLVGLLDSDDAYQPVLTDEELDVEGVLPVVGAVLQATLRKLATLRDLASRLTALKRFLDTRFDPKRVELTRQNGLSIQLASSDETLRPEKLSSGEQQMIVLAYEILFTPAPGTLVIVDEPEISLHVRWQSTLIGDLEEMGRPSNLQFLMATHSPVTLANHPHLERSLDDMG